MYELQRIESGGYRITDGERVALEYGEGERALAEDVHAFLVRVVGAASIALGTLDALDLDGDPHAQEVLARAIAARLAGEDIGDEARAVIAQMMGRMGR